MTKPATSVRSIRLTEDAWTWLTLAAEQRGSNVNSIVAEMVEMARHPPVVASPAIRMKVPLDDLGRIDYQARPPRLDIQIGPTPVKPGSRLRAEKAGKR